MTFQSTRKRSYVLLLKGLAEFKKQPGYRIAKWIIQEGLKELKSQIGWRIDFLLLLVHFLSSWMLMAFFEPAKNEITQWDVYWWFYIVTASTEGYGDYYPTTLGGRLVAVTILMVGFVLLVALLIQINS